MQTIDSARRAQPGAWRVLGAGVLAGAVAVAVNLAIRAVVLAMLDKPDVPYPLVLPPVIEFTFLPCLFGTLLFLLLRRATAQPVRGFTIAAAVVLTLSWVAPSALVVQGRITVGVLLALLVMHATPALILVGTLRRISHPRPPR